MKKVFFIFLIAFAVMCVVSCNEEKKKPTKDPVVEPTPLPTPEPTPEVKYVVTFDVDGKLTIAEVKEGEKAVKPLDPVKDGYTFLGWYLGDALYDFETAVTAEVTLLAKFEEVIYTVTFDVDGKLTTAVVKEGEKIGKPLDPVKEGYTFLGWYLGDVAYDFENSVISDITLTAKFIVNKMSITVDIEGTLEIVDIMYGEVFAVNMLENVDANEVEGIYLDSEYTIKYENQKITEDICLYIRYFKYYNVNIYLNNEVLLSEVVREGDKCSFYNTISNSKYKLSKLFIDKEFNNEFNIDEKITEDKNIYLQYIEAEEYKNINTIMVYSNTGILKAEVKDGEYLNSNLLLQLGYCVGVYLDEQKTNKYCFGAVYEDMVLYADIKEESKITNPVTISYTIIYKGNAVESMEYIVESGDSFSMSQVSRRTDYYLDSIYFDEKLREEYKGTSITEDTKLYVKATDKAGSDACKVSIYSGYSLEKGLDEEAELVFYREFYMKKGESIYSFTFRKKAPSGLLWPYLIYKDSKKFYKGEAITNDTEFIIINDGIPKFDEFNKYILNINGVNLNFIYYNANNIYDFSMLDLKTFNVSGFYKDEQFTEKVEKVNNNETVYVKTE